MLKYLVIYSLLLANLMEIVPQFEDLDCDVQIYEEFDSFTGNCKTYLFYVHLPSKLGNF